MSHTPLPWIATDPHRRVNPEGPFIGPSDGSPVAALTGYYGLDGIVANAEFIVRAVNSHDALINALEQIVDEKCDYMRINHLGDPETQHTIKAARAALSAAREQARKDRT